MKVLYLTAWDRSRLSKAIQFGLNDGCLVIVKRLKQTKDEFVSLMRELGEPRPQHSGTEELVMTMGEQPYSKTKFWYDRSDDFCLHFDGINRIPERGFMPVTALYGADVQNVVGGITYFYDLQTLFERAMTDPVLRRIHWGSVIGKYTRDSAVEHPYDIPTFRMSPYTGRAYLLIDEWFTRDLILPAEDRFTTGTSALQRYRDGFRTLQPYEHVWEPEDLILWSNESLLHGRTRIESGTRVLWRGLIWNNHRHRTTLVT